MAIDQEVKHLVDYYYSLKLPEYDQTTSVKEVRDIMKTFSSKASTQLAPNIKDVHDHYFKTSIGDVRVRSFHPKENTFTRPIIFFRSSGFVIDNFSDSDLFCSKIAAHCETTVLSIDYPLAPENPFPDPVIGGYETLLKIVSDADLFGIDSSGLIMIGESTGGCIAASISQLLRDKKSPSIGYLVLLYPTLDDDFSTESYKSMGRQYILSEDKMRWYYSQYFKKKGSAQKEYALPLKAKSFAGLPKTLIMTAQYDPLCDEGKKYANQLIKAGCSCEHIHYKELIHGFLKFNGFAASENAFLEMVKKIKHFLKEK